MTSKERKTNADLYKALSEGDDGRVCETCRGLPDGPFHILTIHNDSVLHIASYYKRNDLVLKLMSQLPEEQHSKLTFKNEAGNTLLHATASNNKTIGAAAGLLDWAPSLLTMTDNLGETPLFRAARYGKTKIFNFLKEQMSTKFPEVPADLSKTGLLRDDKATMLHVAIHSENFELARYIAETYPFLIDQQDSDGMTGLQLLACKPSAFDCEFKDSSFKRLIYRFIYSRRKGRVGSRVPIIKEIQKQVLKSESAKQLATLLIKSDASWEVTETMSSQNKMKPHKFGPIAQREIFIRAPNPKPDSPLFLATKYGCTEIVMKILEEYPQALEYVNEDGCNILHVAIKYRRMEIYKTVINMKNPLTRLKGKIDNQGNSLLHMVAIKVGDQKTEGDIRSPALLLQDDLLLFESVKEICTTLATLQVNHDQMTGEQLFIKNNAQLRVDAKEWVKSTAENCSIVAVLIATVAFAAAYTVPGGPNQQTGYPLLKSKPFFIVFALADALSLTFSLTSVIVFLSILTSPFRFKDFQTSLHNKLLLGITLLIFSVAMMMVAFAATLILTITSGQDWTNILLYTISFLPVTVFVCSYVHLYQLLIKAFVEKGNKVIASILPACDVECLPALQCPAPPSQTPTTCLTRPTISSSV